MNNYKRRPRGAARTWVPAFMPALLLMLLGLVLAPSLANAEGGTFTQNVSATATCDGNVTANVSANTDSEPHSFVEVHVFIQGTSFEDFAGGATPFSGSSSWSGVPQGNYVVQADIVYGPEYLEPHNETVTASVNVPECPPPPCEWNPDISADDPGCVPPQEGVCEGLDSGKIDTPGAGSSLTITAPDGFLIDRYCVKAGSVQQGDGPEYYDVVPPQESVTITHSSGKNISHYSVSYVAKPAPTTSTVPPTTPTTVTPTTSTVPPTTPTTVTPTTSTVPPTTPTVPPTNPGVTTTTVVPTPPTPAPPTTPPPGNLPVTGSTSAEVVITAIALLLGGIGLVWVARRRHGLI